MGSEAVIATVVADGVAEIWLNRSEARNALSMNFVRALDGTLDHLDAARNVKVLLLTGAGRHFAAGASIKEMRELTMEDALSAFVEKRPRHFGTAEFIQVCRDVLNWLFGHSD